MGLDELKAYEKEFDDKIDALPIWQLPARAILTALHIVVDGLFNGSRSDEHILPRPEAANAAAARLSYLVPALLTCDSDSLGKDASDVISAVFEVDPTGAQQMALLAYGHFSEVMPEVHRGYYSVEGDVAHGFKLQHSSPKFAESETTDIVLNELSLSFISNQPVPDESLFDQQARAASLPLQMEILQFFYDHYRTNLWETPILTDAGYEAAIDATRDEFEMFRAGLFAFADFCKGMARAFVRRLSREGHSDALWGELLEWLSVNWKDGFFDGALQTLTGMDFAKLERLLAMFSVDFRTGRGSNNHVGDGFLPPLARFEGAYLFNPDLLKLFLPMRNVLYALSRTDRNRYDNLVSKYLEPELIEATSRLFASRSELQLVSNHVWSNGEIDLLVYSKAENAALHVQAKAAIPPQGARMVQAVESRALEGALQLRRLRDLAQSERDMVLSAALKQQVSNVEITDVLLSRSCFGTDRIWSALGEVVPINLTLLKSTLECAGADFSVRGFAKSARQELIRLIQLARPQFAAKEMETGDTSVRLPMLDLDMGALRKEQIRIWSDR